MRNKNEILGYYNREIMPGYNIRHCEIMDRARLEMLFRDEIINNNIAAVQMFEYLDIKAVDNDLKYRFSLIPKDDKDE